MTETYFGIALAVLIVFGVYKYIQNRKSKKAANTGGGGNSGGGLPPKQEK